MSLEPKLRMYKYSKFLPDRLAQNNFVVSLRLPHKRGAPYSRSPFGTLSATERFTLKHLKGPKIKPALTTQTWPREPFYADNKDNDESEQSEVSNCVVRYPMSAINCFPHLLIGLKESSDEEDGGNDERET